MTQPLDTILNEIHHHLHHGAIRRKSPMHTPVVGTADGDLRVMVLREFDPVTRVLRFHTDTRSPKVAAIAADPAMTVLLYDPEAKVQIRARGIGRVETSGELADAAWAQSTPFAKRCYLAENAPSADSSAAVSGLPEWVEGITPTEEQVAPGRENFAIVLVQVSSFDWLYLASTGHRRARFEFEGIQVSSTWLVP
jgi:pyridoxamine 5'-phosphate oxidase